MERGGEYRELPANLTPRGTPTFPFRGITYAYKTDYRFFNIERNETKETMGLGYGKGRLVPTGKLGPAIYVSYKISQQLVETKDSNGSSLRQKAVVHSIAAEPGQNIGLGDFDLLVGDDIVRLKHIASDPEWLVLSSDASAILA